MSLLFLKYLSKIFKCEDPKSEEDFISLSLETFFFMVSKQFV